MAEGVDAFISGARMARETAARCLEDSKSADTERGFRLIAEHDRHIERAEWYEDHADMMIARMEREEQKEAAQ